MLTFINLVEEGCNKKTGKYQFNFKHFNLLNIQNVQIHLKDKNN